ncbi:MAG: Gfo/Idh/MocA family oxidoreductase [Verrucomicrobia bacterium]|nr:Gfo/Idh/MocA family oxidoreductase [Verrucomicrobiota bacterium]
MNIPRQLNVAIIGCGVIAPAHIEGFQHFPSVKVVELCDLDKSKADALALRYGIDSVSTSYHTTVARRDVDCVAICTDHASHAPIAIAALNAGKHVLCEKPLGESEQAVQAMVSAAQSNPDLVASGVLQHRFDAVHQALRLAIQEGLLGRPLLLQGRLLCYRSHDYYLNTPWRGKWASEGGSLLMNQAIHFVDILDWLGGGFSEITAAYCNLLHQGIIETEDSAGFTGYFKKWCPRFFHRNVIQQCGLGTFFLRRRLRRSG